MYIRWVEHITHFQRYVVLVMSSSFLSWFLWFFLRDFLRFACNEFGLWCRGVFGSLGTQMVGRAKLFEKLVTTLSRQETNIIRWVETQRFCKNMPSENWASKWWFPIWRISGTFFIFGCFGCFRAFQHLVNVSGHGRYRYPIGKLHVECMFHGHPLVYHKVVWKIYVFLRCRCRMENFWRCKWTHVSRTTWIFTCVRMAGQFEKVPNVTDTTTIFATIGDLFIFNYCTPIIAVRLIRMLFATQWFSSKWDIYCFHEPLQKKPPSRPGAPEKTRTWWTFICPIPFFSLQYFSCWIFFIKKNEVSGCHSFCWFGSDGGF